MDNAKSLYDRLNIFTEQEKNEIAQLTEARTLHQTAVLAFTNNIYISRTEAKQRGEELTQETKDKISREQAARDNEFKILKEISKSIDEIYSTAEERYYNRVNTAPAIMADALKVLKLCGKSPFKVRQEKLAKSKNYFRYSSEIMEKAGKAAELTETDLQALKEMGKEKPELNYTEYRAYLIIFTRLQLQALDYNKLDKTELIELINKKAAKAYPPTPEELAKLEPEPGEILTEQQQLDAIRTAGLPENYTSIIDTSTSKVFNPEWQERAIEQYGERKNGQLFFNDIQIYTGKRGAQEVTSLLSVWYDDESINFTKNGKPIVLNDYDRAVFNAICTLYLNGTVAFTLPMLYGAMTGKDNSEIVITEGIERELIKALNKLQTVRVAVDYNNEAEIYNYENGNTVKDKGFREYIVVLTERPIEINGNPVMAYHIRYKPELLKYGQAKKQIVTIPYKALELKIGEKNTPEVIALRQFLIDEIARIKNPHQTNRITYQAIYSRITYVKGNELTKKQKASIRQSTIKILENFKQKGVIKAYKEASQGREYHHIEITPAPENPSKK